MLGLDVQWLMTCTDPFELELLQEALQRASNLRDLRDQNMAIRIANELVPPLAKILSRLVRA